MLNKELDRAIREYETDRFGTSAGYRLGDRLYPDYLSNPCWEAFLKDMQEHHPAAYMAYGQGSGGELKPRPSRYGLYPPKMASFGSSSRMIYTLMKDNPDFVFEEQLPTYIGGTANLDGYMQTDSRLIFVEAKCREPYSPHNKTVKRVYEELYRAITASPLTPLGCNISPQADPAMMTVEFYTRQQGENQVIGHFDMKQMICHLLAVAGKCLRGETEGRALDFIYLVYDPRGLSFDDPTVGQSIKDIHSDIFDFYYRGFFRELFEVIADYLKTRYFPESPLSPALLAQKFSFTHCGQEQFCDMIADLSLQKT